MLSKFQPRQEKYFAKMVKPASRNFITVAMSSKLYATKPEASIRAGGKIVALSKLKTTPQVVTVPTAFAKSYRPHQSMPAEFKMH